MPKTITSAGLHLCRLVSDDELNPQLQAYSAIPCLPVRCNQDLWNQEDKVRQTVRQVFATYVPEMGPRNEQKPRRHPSHCSFVDGDKASKSIDAKMRIA
jgi:hypothetical protein